MLLLYIISTHTEEEMEELDNEMIVAKAKQKSQTSLDAGDIYRHSQGGITCGAIDEPRKSSKAIDERVIINFCDKNVVIARFRDKNVYR